MSSLTFKLFIICLSFVLTSVTIISHLSSQFVKAQVVERDQEFIVQILSKVNEYLALNFSSIQTILFSVDSFLDSGEYDELRFHKHLDTLYTMNLQSISNVYVIKSDYSMIGGRTITRIVNEPLPELEPVYRDTKADKISTTISKPYQSRFSGWTVTVSRVSRSNPSLVIAADINIDELEEKLLQIHAEEQIQLYIVENSGSIIATSRQDSVLVRKSTRIGDTPTEQIISDNRDSMFIPNQSQAENLLIKRHSPTYNWVLVAVSDGARLSRTLHKIDRHFMNLIIIGLLLSLLIAVMITRYIRRPVLGLTRKMKQVEQGKLDVRIATKRKDEFGYLSKSFDKMLNQINDLFMSLSKNKEWQKKLEIQVLQAQINPHFLYNTLGAISNVVRLGHLEQVDPVIRSLISILEYGIKDPSYQVPLKEELRNVKDYVTIQNIRYQREFRIVEAIDPRLLEIHVFRMFLQPIVENSIFHGYRGGREEGDIRISAFTDGRLLIIEIEDDGIGVSKEKRDTLLEPEEPAMEPGIVQRRKIGLANIHGRIRLHYGEQYGIRLMDTNKGTCVRVELPYVQEGDVENGENPLPDHR